MQNWTGIELNLIILSQRRKKTVEFTILQRQEMSMMHFPYRLSEHTTK